MNPSSESNHDPLCFAPQHITHLPRCSETSHSTFAPHFWLQLPPGQQRVNHQAAHRLSTDYPGWPAPPQPWLEANHTPCSFMGTFNLYDQSASRAGSQPTVPAPQITLKVPSRPVSRYACNASGPWNQCCVWGWGRMGRPVVSFPPLISCLE